jgi:hypothetical protein
VMSPLHIMLVLRPDVISIILILTYFLYWKSYGIKSIPLNVISLLLHLVSVKRCHI